jgi:hypothetical protein
MRTSNDLAGVHVALTTPYEKGNGSVDVDALEQHVRWLLDNGIAGLVPNGALGEQEVLSADERRAVVGKSCLRPHLVSDAFDRFLHRMEVIVGEKLGTAEL